MVLCMVAGKEREREGLTSLLVVALGVATIAGERGESIGRDQGEGESEGDVGV